MDNQLPFNLSALRLAADVVEEDALPSDAVGLEKVAEKVEGEANELTCAICLEQIVLEGLATVKGCGHIYCAKCILSWAAHKDWCPQCKAPFTHLLTYRHLDGTFSDVELEESVVLMRRATWFEALCKEADKGKAPAGAGGGGEECDWHDYSRFYDEYDDDEEVEAYYFSSAAGRARIVLGNRRFGENGYIASGRMHARPAQQAPTAKGKGKAAESMVAPPRRPPPQKTPDKASQRAAYRAASGSEGPSPAASGSGCSSTEKQGRRARRNEKRNRADQRAGICH